MKSAPDTINHEGQEYVSIGLAATIAGYHPQYIRRMVLRNEIPAIRRTYDGFVKVYVLRSALTRRSKMRRVIVRIAESELKELEDTVKALGGVLKDGK